MEIYNIKQENPQQQQCIFLKLKCVKAINVCIITKSEK